MRGERGGDARTDRAAPGLARRCDPAPCRGGEPGTGCRRVWPCVPDRTRLRAVERARLVADATVSAGRTSGRRAGRPVAHRVARGGVDAMRRAAPSAARRRHAQRPLSGAAGTVDGATDDREDVVGFAGRDAVTPHDRRHTPLSADTVDSRAQAPPRTHGSAAGELGRACDLMLKNRFSFTRNVSLEMRLSLAVLERFIILPAL